MIFMDVVKIAGKEVHSSLNHLLPHCMHRQRVQNRCSTVAMLWKIVDRKELIITSLSYYQFYEHFSRGVNELNFK